MRQTLLEGESPAAVIAAVSAPCDRVDRSCPLVLATRDGYLLVDREGRLVDVNDAYCAMLGYRRADLLGLHLSDLEPEIAVERLRRRADAVGGGLAASFETRHRRKDGALVDVEVSTVSLDFRGGVSIAFVRDISRRKAIEREMRSLAYFDALTGLANRRLLLDRLSTALADSARQRGTLALLFADLDRFKMVNDTLGHETGDRVLCEVAARLQRSVRTSDVVSRSGGDEFIILLPDIGGPADAEAIGTKLVAALAEPFQIRGHSISVGVSIGLAISAPGRSADGGSMLRDADMAMYRAKAAGGCGVRVA